MIAPCKNCPDRYLGCHSRCPKFLEWKKEKDDIREAYLKEKALYNPDRRQRSKWK